MSSGFQETSRQVCWGSLALNSVWHRLFWGRIRNPCHSTCKIKPPGRPQGLKAAFGRGGRKLLISEQEAEKR